MLSFKSIDKRFEELKSDYNYEPPKLRKPNWKITSESALAIHYYPVMKDNERLETKLTSIYLTTRGESSNSVIEKIKSNAKSLKERVINLFILLWERFQQFVKGLHATIQIAHIKVIRKSLESAINLTRSSESYDIDKFNHMSFTIKDVKVHDNDLLMVILDDINLVLDNISESMDYLNIIAKENRINTELLEFNQEKNLTRSSDVVDMINSMMIDERDSVTSIPGSEVIHHANNIYNILNSILTMTSNNGEKTLHKRFAELYRISNTDLKNNLISSIKQSEEDINYNNIISFIIKINKSIMDIQGSTHKFIGIIIKLSTQIAKIINSSKKTLKPNGSIKIETEHDINVGLGRRKKRRR